MNDIITFSNEAFGNVRIAVIENEPWFVGKDVAVILGYSNPQKAIRDHVDEDDKTVNESFTVNGTQIVLINESGVYNLIFSSKLPKAKEFKRWVTAEILPSIRKNGGYVNNEEQFADAFLPYETPSEVRNFVVGCLKVMKDSKQVIKQQATKIAEQDCEIKALKPDADYCREVLDTDDLMLVTTMAKSFDMTGAALNKYLVDKGVLFKRNGVYHLTKNYQGQDYARYETRKYTGNDGRIHKTDLLMWTEKGRRMVYELLKADGLINMAWIA